MHIWGAMQKYTKDPKGSMNLKQEKTQIDNMPKDILTNCWKQAIEILKVEKTKDTLHIEDRTVFIRNNASTCPQNAIFKMLKEKKLPV